MASKSRASDNRDYMQIVSDLYANDGGDDLYQSLMRRERNVLNTVNRVANDVRADASAYDGFLRMPLPALLQRFHTSLMAVGSGLGSAKTAADVHRAVFSEDRSIYVGVLLVVVALFLLLVQEEIL
jgi:hypothetical protein